MNCGTTPNPNTQYQNQSIGAIPCGNKHESLPYKP